VKKKELENYLVAMCEKHNPDIIGNDYVVLGTIDRDLHQKGKQGKLNINTPPNKRRNNFKRHKKYINVVSGY